MSIATLKKAIRALDISDETPILILGWKDGRRVAGGVYPLHPKMAEQLSEVAQAALDRIDHLEMAAYDGPTLLATGEEGLWVPADRLNSDAALFSLLTSPDLLETLTSAEVAEHALSLYAIGFGAEDAERTYFVKRRARQIKGETQLLGVLQIPMRPVQGSVLALDREIDFILRDEGAVVFEAGAFERYIQDPEDVGAELDQNLSVLAEKVPFSAETIKMLSRRGRQGSSLLRRRVRSILESSHFATLSLDKVRAEFRRLKRNPNRFIRDDELCFNGVNSSFVLKVLDESAWRGGFSDVLYTTSGKRRE